MKGTLLVIGLEKVEERALETTPTLEQLKAVIDGGWLETVPRFDTIHHKGKDHKCWAFCDEEGKLKHLPFNSFATALWEVALQEHGLSLFSSGSPADVLCGTIGVIFGDDELMESL